MDSGDWTQSEIDVDADAIARQVDELQELLTPLLEDSSAPVPPRLTACLFDFYITAQEQHCWGQVGESARSLASLLHSVGDRPLREQERLQVSVLVETLMQDFAPRPSGAADAHRPLVTPIVPTQATVNTRVALYVDNAPLLVMLRETLRAAGFEPQVFESLEAMAAVDEANFPAAIVAELSLCRLNPQAADMFANLRGRFSPPPHLICIAPTGDIPARLEAVRLGATRFLGLPVDTARLVAILKGVTVQVPARPFRVVAVDDDPFVAEVCRDQLEEAGIRTQVVTDPLQAPAIIKAFEPDLILCDIFMPGCNGMELLSLLRQDDDLVDTPIVLLSSDPDIERRLEALSLGADEFLLKPVDMSLLVAAVTARARRARSLKRSRVDYRRLHERVRLLERQLADAGQETVGEAIGVEMPAETINMDDYVVKVVESVKKT